MAGKEKNILLVSLENLEDGINYKYFYHSDGENIKFCNSILHAEVTTKYILSKVNIDEIVVIGSGATYDPGDDLRKVTLKDGEEFLVSNIHNLSEYSLYRYRLSEYLEGLDLEEHDVLSDISDEDKTALIDIINKFHNDLGQRTEKKRKDIFFSRLSKSPAIYDELIESLPENLKEKEPWLKRYLYSIMTDSYKLRPLESNENVLVSFIPTTKANGDNIDVGSILRIMDLLKGSDDEIVNLYIDMQGLERTDDFTMISVLSILKNEWKNRVCIQEILSTSSSEFACEIKNERLRYEINDLLASMYAFIKYGKVGSLRRYWEERNTYDEHIEELLSAMQYVDDGISLCNIEDLEYGICELGKILAEEADEDDCLENNILKFLKTGIRRDFGPLLDTDENDNVDVLELIKWAYRKEFYQQALTIIESRIPEDFVKSGIFYYAENDSDRERAITILSDIYNETLPKDRYQLNDINHYFIKFYCRRMMNYRQDPIKIQQDYAKFRTDFIGKDNPDFLKAYSLLEDREELEELLFSYFNIGIIRNQVSHGKSGVKKYPGQRKYHKQNENIRLIREAIEYFIQQYEEAKKKVKDKNAVIVFVSGNDVKIKASYRKKRSSYIRKKRVEAKVRNTEKTT